jgi:hypothetical protein
MPEVHLIGALGYLGIADLTHPTVEDEEEED